MAQHDALQTLLTETSLALSRLRAVNSPERAVAFLRELGYEVPAAAIGPALPALAAEAGGLTAAVRQLADAEGAGAVATALVTMLGRVDSAVDAIRALHAELQSTSASIPHIEELPRRLTDFLLLDYLERQRPQLHDTLHLLGLIERVPAPQPGQPSRLVNWERFGLFFEEPSRIADEVYRWNTDFDSDTFLERLFKVMQAAPLPGGLHPQADATRAALGNASPLARSCGSRCSSAGSRPRLTRSSASRSRRPMPRGQKERVRVAALPDGRVRIRFRRMRSRRAQVRVDRRHPRRRLVVRPPLDVDPLLNLQGAFQAACGSPRSRSAPRKSC